MTPNPDEQITWTGVLDDDCTARWAGLMLRAERMESRHWWWAVSDLTTGGEIESSNDYNTRCLSGSDARSLAEVVARDYIMRQRSS